MNATTSLLYASYKGVYSPGPVRKVKLLPIRKLIRLSVITVKREFNVRQYLRVYTCVFGVMAAGIVFCLVLFGAM